MRATAAALLSLWLVGCAPAATLRTSPVHPTAAPPVSQWETGSEDEAAVTTEEPLAEERAALATGTDQTEAAGQTETPAQTEMTSNEPLPFGGIEPEVVHRARIEMARAALVEENQNKERVDLAEELQRELAALQASTQTSKSRVRHGGPTKKQP